MERRELICIGCPWDAPYGVHGRAEVVSVTGIPASGANVYARKK